jgi:hypothetical protein
MLLAAPSVLTARTRLAHWRALLFEERSTLRVRIDEPGSLLMVAGITLIELSTQLGH